MAKHVGRDVLRRVTATMERIAPARLAGSWDNVGLIAEASSPRDAGGVFVSVDLTTDVADELLACGNINTAVVYHPVIFSAVKSITMQQPIQRSILRCITSGVSIYCPHTTLDVIEGGINDWIAAGLSWEGNEQAKVNIYERTMQAQFAPVTPSNDARGSREGLGRVAPLHGCAWATLIARVKEHLGIDFVQVAPAPGVSADTQLKQAAVCAGSGGSILRDAKDADVCACASARCG